MKKQANTPNLDEAKKLIEQHENAQIQAQTNKLTDCINAIIKDGFDVVIRGHFTGDKMQAGFQIIKRK